jgi:hypothetical protein
MDNEIHRLIIQAQAGDAEAQRDLAIRLHEGDGVERDEEASLFWLKEAAKQGDAWAQTTYGITLRTAGGLENERESVRWLSLAADQRDERARTNLAAQQLLGIGTTVDLETGATNLIMASLSGSADAQKLFEQRLGQLDTEMWDRIVKRVQWALLTFLLGPSEHGHLSKLYKACRGGNAEAVAKWLSEERDIANSYFLSTTQPILMPIFGIPVIATAVYVSLAIVHEELVAAATMSLGNIRQNDGKPVWWKPQSEALDTVAATIGIVQTRRWVRWTYTHF